MVTKSKTKEKYQPVDFSDHDIPANVTEAERLKILKLIQDPKPLDLDNSAMLATIKNKKFTTADRIQTLFVQQNFSPLTRLIRLVKTEESKMEVWNRAIDAGLEPRLMEFLPKPDKKFYATLLLQLVRFEVPELKSVEVSGQVEAGMTVTIQTHQPQMRIIKIDGKSPEKIRLLHGNMDRTIKEEAQAVAVEVVDDI